MKKTIFGVIILILVGFVAFVWLMKVSFLSSYLSEKMRVPVSMSQVSIFPRHTSIRDFAIRNPKGFKSRTAFEVEKVDLDYNWRNLFGNPVILDQIILDQIFLRVEFSNGLGTQNNWTAIARGMPKPERGKEVIIRKLILLGVNVEITGLGLTGKAMRRTVDRIELDDIDSRNGFPTEELIKQIFGGMGIQQFIKDAFNPQQMMQKAIQLFGENEEAPLESGAVNGMD